MNNTLYNNDSLQLMDDFLIPWGFEVDAIITDPPYGLVKKYKGKIHLFRQSDSIHTKDNMDFDNEFNQLSWLEKAVKLLKKGGHLIVFNDWENMGDIARELRRLNMKVKTLNHWQKTNPLPSEWRRRFVPGREYFIHAIKHNGNYTFNVDKVHHGDFIMGLTPNGEKSHGLHPTQKPIALMEDIVSILTKEGDTVLDPFMGSGTTGVACKNLGREFVGVEMNKGYFDIASDRLNE